MRRGEIYWVELDPTRGSEANKTRPAVIVSNNNANTVAARTGRGVISVVPVTSNITRIYPFQVFLAATECDLGRDSKAQAEQVRTVAVDRIGEHVGCVSDSTLTRIDTALRLHLALE